MRILHLTGENEDTGGVLTVLRNLDTVTRPWGWQNVVWVNEAFQEKRSPPLDLVRNPHICADSYNHFKIMWRAAAALPALYRLAQNQRFDVVHAHTRGGILVGLGLVFLTRQPIVYTNHNYPRRLGLYQWIARRQQVYTVLLTPNMGRFCHIPVDGRKVRVIYSCCSDDVFQVPITRSSAGWNPGKPLRLIGLGSLLRWKNWHVAAKALTHLTEAERQRLTFDLWGPTPDFPEARVYEAELRQLIQQGKLEAIFLLRGSTRTPIKELGRADWLVHPAFNEPCGLAVIESLALGLPVLASASGAMLDIIQPGRNGLLFEPDNPEDLARQLRKILRGEVQLDSPLDIRRSVEMHSATTMSKLYGEVYKLARRAPGKSAVS